MAAKNEVLAATASRRRFTKETFCVTTRGAGPASLGGQGNPSSEGSDLAWLRRLNCSSGGSGIPFLIGKAEN